MVVLNAQERAGVQTILNLSPAVCAAALSAAELSGLSLEEWLEHRVSYAMADDEVMITDGLNGIAPWSLACADLFVEVANSSPGTLSGKWQLLYERVKLEKELWHWPTSTLEEVEGGMLSSKPYVSNVRLRAAWPRLCATIFCM